MAGSPKWTKEKVIALAKKFETIKDFRSTYPSAANHAYKHGYKDEAFDHIKRKPLTVRRPLKTGQKYGRLTFKKDLGMIRARDSSLHKRRYGLFICDCGNPSLQQIEISKVKAGKTKSCGECRFFETPNEYGETKSKCLVCGVDINTKINRLYQGRGKTCSRECMYEWRKLREANKHIGFKHEKGQLKVVEFKITKNNQPNTKTSYEILAECECDCGKLNYYPWNEVRNGTYLRCYTCEDSIYLEKLASYQDIKGKRYGRLVVTAVEFTKKPLFVCDCDCGVNNHKVDSLKLLEGGFIISCGCTENTKRDTYKSFKNNKEHRERRCEVFLAEISEPDRFVFGMSENSEAHLNAHGGYTNILRINKNLNRAKCWCIVQILLIETEGKYYLDVTGQEVRASLEVATWSKRFDSLVEEASSTGWRALYEKHLASQRLLSRKDFFRCQ